MRFFTVRRCQPGGQVAPVHDAHWQFLVLFVGLFVLTEGLERTGLVADLVPMAGRIGLHRPAILTATTAVLSNLVSNVLSLWF